MSMFSKINRVADAIATACVGPSHRTPVKLLVYIAFAAAAIWVPYAIFYHVYTSGFHVVSVEREERIGNEFASSMEKDLVIMKRDNPVSLYVSEIGTSVAREHNPWMADFRFKVIENPNVVNAGALPGGRIYITTGLLKRLDNEAELAMVLAHEVAHVSERHYARNIGRQMLISWGKKFLGGTDQTMLAAGSYLTANVTFFRMRQEDELEADSQGETYIYQLGYDPSAGVTLMRKLLDIEKQTPESLRVMAITHPPSRERLEAMKQLMETLPEKGGLALQAERYKEKIK